MIKFKDVSFNIKNKKIILKIDHSGALQSHMHGWLARYTDLRYIGETFRELKRVISEKEWFEFKKTRFLKEMTYQKILYLLYKRLVKIVLSIFKNYPYLATSDIFILNIRLIGYGEATYAGRFIQSKLDEAFIEVSIDRDFVLHGTTIKVEQTILHELQHHFDHPYILYARKLRERLQALGWKDKISDATLHLINIVTMLRTEGVARFINKLNSPGWFTLDFEIMEEYRKDLNYLLVQVIKPRVHTIVDEKDLEEERRMNFLYDAGSHMCLMIALNFLRSKTRYLMVRAFYGHKKEKVKLRNLGKAIKEFHDLSFSVLKEKEWFPVFIEAVKFIRELDHNQFIRIYEKSCKELGIPEACMIIQWNYYNYLKKKATRYYEKVSQRNLGKMEIAA